MKGFVLTLIAILLGILVMAGMMNGCGSGLIEEVGSMPIEPENVEEIEDGISPAGRYIVLKITEELSKPESVVRSKHEPTEPKVESAEKEPEEVDGQVLQPVDSEEVVSDVDQFNTDGGGGGGVEEVAPEPNSHLWGVATITHYCSCSICAGQWAGGPTASGVMPTPNHTVACGDLPFGTRLLINGQEYTIEDRGVSGLWVDIYCASHEEALQRGMYQAEVYIVD